MDRNGGLQLGAVKTDDIWFYLLERSMNDMNVLDTTYHLRSVEVKADGQGGHPFILRFPFSYFISMVKPQNDPNDPNDPNN